MQNVRSLFLISSDLDALEALLYDLGGEITDEAAEKAIDAWLGELGAERDAKVDNYCGLRQEFLARAEARQREADRLHELARVEINAAERLKARGLVSD